MKEKQTMKSIFEYVIKVLITNINIKQNLQQTTVYRCSQILSRFSLNQDPRYCTNNRADVTCRKYRDRSLMVQSNLNAESIGQT